MNAQLKLGEIITQIRGVSYKPSDVRAADDPDAVALLRANNIQEDGLNFDDLVWVDKHKVSAEQYLRMGDILICSSSGSKGLVGKAAIVTNGLSCAFGAFCKVVRTKAEYASYLGQFFRSPRYRKEISASAAGANINNIRNEHIDDMFISMPSENERAGCVAKLGQIDYLIQKSNNQTHQLDQLVKSRFVEMFGEPVNNSKGYPIHQLSDHILFLTSGSRGWAQYYTDKGEWFITIKNVKDCRISVDDVQCINPPKNAEAERTRLREGDLLISITADLGRTGVVTKEIAEHGAYNNQHLTCIRLDRLVLDPLYVAFFMESEAGKRQFEAKNMSAVKAGLNFDSIRSLKLIVPPLALQKEFSAFVAEVDKSKLAVKQSLEKLETLKKSLMQQYFG